MIFTLLTANGNADNVAEDLPANASFNDAVPYIILILAIVFIGLLFYLLFKKKRNKELWEGKSLKRSTFLPAAYKVLSNFPLTKGYIEKISYRYRMITPCDSREIAKKTIFTCLISWGICIITFLIIFLLNPRFINLIIAVFAIVITDAEVIGRIASSFIISSNQETQKFIADVEHYFYVNYRVDDAIYRAKDNLSPNMKAAAEQIYQLLLADDKEDALREYYENVPNKYLRAFVKQCVIAMERGNLEVNGKPLFVRNMESLQCEIDIDVENRQRLNMEFMGVILCVIGPIFFIDYIKWFSVSIKENLADFYYGREGFLIDVGILIITSCIYVVMRKSAEYASFHQSAHRILRAVDKVPFIKKALNNYCDKNATKMERLKKELRNNGYNIKPRLFILRSFLLAGTVLLLSIGILFFLHGISKNQLLAANTADVELLTSAAKENQYEKMGEVIETYTRRYVKEPKTVPASLDAMVSVLERESTFKNKVINEALAKDILFRVGEYQQEYFSFLDFLISVLLCIVAYYIPKLLLKYNSTVSKDAMEDEVNQLNAMISMLMFIDSMTVKQILKEMESFAVVFKQSLQICINDYGTGHSKALEEMKEREAYEPFNRIVDNLIRCDAMPIYEAFHEIDVERDGYIANRKLKNEKSRKRRVRRAYLLALIPFFLLLTYGILPPLLASINEINTTINELENIPW